MKGNSNMIFDLIIKNGLIYDGEKSEPSLADIGIKGDKIAFVGEITESTADVIDARDCIVTPGFIDVHTHCDVLFQRVKQNGSLDLLMPLLEGNLNYQFQGVTTVITGNCGLGITHIDEWLDFVDAINFGSNVGHLVPHGMIRKEPLVYQLALVMSRDIYPQQKN